MRRFSVGDRVSIASTDRFNGERGRVTNAHNDGYGVALDNDLSGKGFFFYASEVVAAVDPIPENRHFSVPDDGED